MNPVSAVGRVVFSVSIALLTASVVFVGCKKEDNPSLLPTPKNIAEIITSNDKLTLLTAAVNRAGLATTLAGTGPFTVFAPSDDAFRAAGYADAAAINAVPVATLSNLLLYHVVSGTALAGANFSAGQTTVPTSVSGSTPLFVNKGSAVSVNNAKVAQETRATNGVIQVIDQVLMPPAGNVLQIVVADTSLALLRAAAVRGGAAVTSALSGTAPITVFAPTNAAFRAAGYADTSAINKAPVATLTAVLTNHVVAPARAYSPTLVNGPVATFGGGSVTVAVGSNSAITLLSKGNGTAVANVTKANINATNGVIHKIDKVLLP